MHKYTSKCLQDMELSLRKAESEKQSKDHNIRSLQDEMAQQDELVAKLNKEKKHQEEVESGASTIRYLFTCR